MPNQPDLTDDSHQANVRRMTTQRRHLLHDLVGIRERRGVDEDWLLQQLSVTRAYLYRFERDPESTDPTLDFLLRYAHAAGAAVSMSVEPMGEADV